MIELSGELREKTAWTDFWNENNFWTYPDLFRVNADLFFKKAGEVLNFSKSDKVLNIGCGPGFLENNLSSHVAAITAVDTSESFLRLCRENTAQCLNVQVITFKEGDYADLSVLKGPYSLFLCISVIQYYRSLDEVEKLIRSAQKIASPGARMMIADIPVRKNLFGDCRDLIQSFRQARKEGYAETLVKQMGRQWRKILDYRAYSKKAPHLYLSENDLNKMIERMKLKVKRIPESFSICANRWSLLIEL